MRVAFLSRKSREMAAYGVMSLAGSLRRHGHQVCVVPARDALDACTHPEIARADVVGMSATTGLHRVYVRWARALREAFPEKCLVLGGPHPTFFPEVIHQAPLDGICIGEGEESLPELLTEWQAGLSQPPDGWWIRRDRGRGPVVPGHPRGPVQNLDSLPSPAFDLQYDADARFRRLPIRVFLPTRGCPFRCTYCYNRTLNDRHRAFGPILRHHDPDRILDDIESVLRRWNGRLIWFLDANFVADQRWLEQFAPRYARRIGLPFFCKLRPEQASHRVVRRLVDAGCTAVGVGVESGSERIRRELLGRRASDHAILDACRRLKSHGVKLLTFSMLGLPGESFDDALRTLALNVACGADYAGATIYQPYPGTALAQRCVDEGWFDGDFDALSYSYFAESPLRFASQADRDRITNLQRLFGLAVEFPEVRSRLRRLTARPASLLYRYLFEARHDWVMRRTFHRAFRRSVPRVAGSAAVFDAACRSLSL